MNDRQRFAHLRWNSELENGRLLSPFTTSRIMEEFQLIRKKDKGKKNRKEYIYIYRF